MSESTLVPISALSRKALARETLAAILRLERHMSDLDDAVASLNTAVTDIATRLLGRLDTLQTQLADAQAGEAAALTDATENAAAIRADVDQLNAIGQPPAVAGTAEADSHVAGH